MLLTLLLGRCTDGATHAWAGAAIPVKDATEPQQTAVAAVVKVQVWNFMALFRVRNLARMLTGRMYFTKD